MKVLIIGNLGYIGPMVAKHFRVTHPGVFLAGYDIGYFVQNNTFNGIAGDTLLDVQHYGDVRNFDEILLNGFDAVIYLAAISNDPMGNAFETELKHTGNFVLINETGIYVINQNTH